MTMLLSPVLLNIERVVVVFLTVVAFLLAVVSFRGKIKIFYSKNNLFAITRASSSIRSSDSSRLC